MKGYRFGTMLARVAAVCLLAAPAHAALVADFNGDGIPDHIVLPRPPETNIVIRVSGAAPQVLELSGRVISIVAADIDHDGDLDLTALSERRGVLVWLNKGGNGQLKRVKTRPQHGSAVTTSGPLASAPESSDDPSDVQAAQDDVSRLAHLVGVGSVIVPVTSSQSLHVAPAVALADRGHASTSRAPPTPRAA